MLPGSFLVMALYWGLVYPHRTSEPGPVSYLTHGANSIIIALDVYLSNQPYYLLHGIWFFVYDIAYLLFTLVYWAAGGTQCDGEPYIYSVLNWNKPSTAGFYSTIVLFGAVPVANLLFFVLVGCCWQGQYRVYTDADKNGVHDSLEAGAGPAAADAVAET